MKHFFRFLAFGLLTFLLVSTGGGCGGSSKDTLDNDSVSRLDAESIYQAVREDIKSAGLIKDISQGRVVAAYRVESANVSGLKDTSLAAGNMTLSFRARSSSGKFMNVGCFSDSLKEGGYYAFLFREHTDVPWNESLTDQVLTFDNNYSFSALLSENASSFEFALLEVDPGAFIPRDSYTVRLQNNSEPANETVHRKVSVLTPSGRLPLYVYASVPQDQVPVVGSKYETVLKTLSDAHSVWSDYAAAAHLQDLIGWDDSFFEALAAALAEPMATESAARGTAGSKAINMFLSNVPKWEQSGEGLGVPDIQFFMYRTGLSFADIVNVIESGTWNGHAGSAGFFKACREKGITFNSLHDNYAWWCATQPLPKNPSDVNALESFMADYFTQIETNALGVSVDPAAAALGILNMAWDFVKSGKPVAQFASTGTRVLLNDDMEPMNFVGSKRIETGKFTYTTCDSLITSWETSRLEVRGVMDYLSTYKGSKLKEWQNKGYFIPNFYIKTEKCTASFGISLNASATCGYPVNRGPVDMSYAKPEVEGNIEIRTATFGLFGNQTFIDFKIDGQSGFTKFTFR